MTATGHALIGTVIAAKITNPYLAIPIALASHVFADLTPHWDAGTNGRKKSKRQLRFEATMDVLLGFAVSYLLILYIFPTTNLAYAFVMIIASQFFDWVAAPYYFFNMKFPPFTWMYRFQSRFNTRLDKPWGIIIQAAIVGFIIYLGTL